MCGEGRKRALPARALSSPVIHSSELERSTEKALGCGQGAWSNIYIYIYLVGEGKGNGTGTG